MEVGSRGIEQALLNELDVGVLLQPFDEQTFNSIELCNYPLMVLLRRDATWATRKKINLEELQHQSFLMFPENFSLNSIILDACKQHGFTQPLLAVPANGISWQTWCYNVWESRFFLNIIPTCLTRLYLQQCHSKNQIFSGT
jgi:DNA-binding transcriptional LysR family regulator